MGKNYHLLEQQLPVCREDIELSIEKPKSFDGTTYKKLNIAYLWWQFILTEYLLPFLFSVTINTSQKGIVSEMIETKAEVSKDLEKALQALER